jgi:lipopolysaccharide export LptBFGC system permease protein LptF
MLAGVLGLQFHKRYGLAYILGGGIVIGFLFYAASHFLRTLGSAGTIPVIPATWLATLVVAVLSLILLLRFEEWRKSY